MRALAIALALLALPVVAQAQSDLVFSGTISTDQTRGYSIALASGANPAIGTSYETIANQSTLYTYSATAVTMTVTSSATADNQWILVEGMGSDYVLKTTEVQLTGRQRVQLTGTWLRVLKVYNNTAGGSAFTGDVYVFEGDDTTSGGVPQTATKIRAKLDADQQQSTMAIYTIPEGYRGQLKNFTADCAKGDDAEVGLFVREFNKTFRQVTAAHCFENHHEEDYSVGGIAFPDRTDVELRGVSSAGPANIIGGFELLLIQAD